MWTSERLEAIPGTATKPLEASSLSPTRRLVEARRGHDQRLSTRPLTTYFAYVCQHGGIGRRVDQSAVQVGVVPTGQNAIAAQADGPPTGREAGPHPSPIRGQDRAAICSHNGFSGRAEYPSVFPTRPGMDALGRSRSQSRVRKIRCADKWQARTSVIGDGCGLHGAAIKAPGCYPPSRRRSGIPDGCYGLALPRRWSRSHSTTIVTSLGLS